MLDCLSPNLIDLRSLLPALSIIFRGRLHLPEEAQPNGVAEAAAALAAALAPLAGAAPAPAPT